MISTVSRPRRARVTIISTGAGPAPVQVTRCGGVPRRAGGGTVLNVSVPTLRDVAALAGVHPATASRALNPATKGMTSADTAERVLRAAEQLGYRPNAVARSLRTARSSSIGVVVPDLTNPLFPPIVRGIEAALAPHGYVLLIVNTDNNLTQEAQLVASLRARSIDGLILATARLSHPLLETLAAGDLPVVLVNRHQEGLPLPSVVPDDAAGIRPGSGSPGRARPPPDRAHRRPAEHLHRGRPAARLPRCGAGARDGPGPEAGPAGRIVVGGRGRARAAGPAGLRRAVLRRHRRERHDRGGLLRRAARARARQSGRPQRGRLQRHAVRGQAAAGADHRARPAASSSAPRRPGCCSGR